MNAELIANTIIISALLSPIVPLFFGRGGHALINFVLLTVAIAFNIKLILLQPHLAFSISLVLWALMMITIVSAIAFGPARRMSDEQHHH